MNYIDKIKVAFSYFMMFVVSTVNIANPFIPAIKVMGGVGVVLSSPVFAETSNTQLLDDLKRMYDLDNPERNHQDGGITAAMEEGLNRTPKDLTQTLSDAINNTSPSKTYDFTQYNKDTTTEMEGSRNEANNIGQTMGAPKTTASGGVKLSYAKQGTRKISRDASGNLVMSDVTGVEYVNDISLEDVVSNEINNNEYDFQADGMHGEADQILEEGAKTNISLKNGKTGSARAYQALTQSADRAINTRVDPDAAWLNSTWNKLSDVESNQGEFFQACEDQVTTDTQELNTSSTRQYFCQDLTQSSLDYCDVERVVRVPLFSIGPGLRSCGLGCYEFDLSVATWGTRSCRETWNPSDNVDPAQFKLMLNTEEYDLVNVNFKGKAWDHFKVSVNGESVWASQGNPYTQGTTGHWGGSGHCNPSGGSNRDGQMDVDVTNTVNSIIGDSGGIQELDFLGELKWKGGGGMEITVQIIVEDKTGLGLESEFIQTPDGCYDALDEEQKLANPLTGFYSPEEMLGITNDSYESRAFCRTPVVKPLCKSGETLFGNVTQEVCLTNARPIQKYCQRGLMGMYQQFCYEDARSHTTTEEPITTTYSCPYGGDVVGDECKSPVLYIERCNADQSLRYNMQVNGVSRDRCSRTPTNFTQRNWSCGDGQVFNDSQCTVSPFSYQTETGSLIQTVNSSGYTITPYDSDGALYEFEDFAICSTTHTPEEVEEPLSFCVFENYEIMEEGLGDHHPAVLDLVPDFFAGDTGHKTWKVNLAGYKCNPLYADVVGIEHDSGEATTHTWEEIREMDNQCQEYIDDEKCNEVARSCGEGWLEEQTDRCIADTVTYHCTEESTLEIKHDTVSNVCESAIPCAGGNCELGEDESNGKFVEAVLMSSVMQGAEDDRSCEIPDDPSSCRIFEGEYEYCSWDLTGMGADCCEEPVGINILAYIQMGQATMKMNAMTGQGAFNTTYLGEVADGAWNYMSSSPVGELAGGAWDAVSTPITSATESLFGTAAGATEGAASAAASAGGVGGGFSITAYIGDAINAVQQKAMALVYNMLPDALAKMVMTETTKNGATEYAMNGLGDGLLGNAAGMIMGAYSIYSWAKLAISLLTACDEKEMDMGTKLGQRQCVSFGDPYCSIGSALCIQRRQDHCCYNSILARIIMEQALPMVGREMNDQCEGLTQDELGSIDFSNINLDEWAGLLHESGEMPTESNEQILTGGGELSEDAECEKIQTWDPVTQTYLTEEECFGQIVNGRVINADERKVVSDRTTERATEIGDFSGTAEQSAIDKLNNLDCSVIPRPPVCSFGFDPRENP